MSIRLVCPVEPAHGQLLPVKDPSSRWGWHCPSQDHDGRLSRHPLGPAPRTRAFFTTAEITAGQLDAQASRPGERDLAEPGGSPSRDTARQAEAPAGQARPSPSRRRRVSPRALSPAATHPTVPRAAGLDPFPFAVAPGIPNPGG